jgi:hypothetical protein
MGRRHTFPSQTELPQQDGTRYRTKGEEEQNLAAPVSNIHCHLDLAHVYHVGLL